METRILDGNTLRKILVGGARGIRSQIKFINELNVFPVPDGDTGTNMTKTIESGISKIPNESDVTVGNVASNFAKGSLLGARGNSGVILSQYFDGFSNALSGRVTATAKDFANASLAGVEKAYAAVANPVEGTILTVFRESAQYAMDRTDDETTLEQFLSLNIEEARRSLERTKEILPVLAEADVVDSGGAGYLSIAQGMYDALTGKSSDNAAYINEGAEEATCVNYDLFTTDTQLEWGYCTECLIRLQRSKGDPECFDKESFSQDLEMQGCNSIVLTRNGDILKLHAHTMTPGIILNMCQKYGEFLNVKIENMCLQHSEKMKKEEKSAPKAHKKIHKMYGVVTVANGDGMKALFKELGADAVIDGGQTSNPSAEDFLNTFENIDADFIIVLPNNGNILLTALQAEKLWGKGNVKVIPTKTISQGYSALSVFNPTMPDIEEQLSDMSCAKDSVVSAEVSTAIRDAVMGGLHIKEGNSIGILEGMIVSSGSSVTETVCDMISKIPDIEDKEILTLFVGRDVTDDERVEVTQAIEEKFDNLSVDVFIGGQAIYKYLIAAE